ncbi:MAG: RdgB/HAM1 family non-canonical purine NTP pyrophosphatase [Betaproteobacteria bacterium AqS2]|uniref:dITP/XTP pyrophosphatase n=1 Tax=Candidatus Amphirhobacter heronislandensis TaxID=1732024 RepID=A0A930UF43_9GAMM|nr:RdgB/HAM1 family non-canonical purine NTP pyrophosphatase [Betaproteobacteria bacterium AqS2]
MRPTRLVLASANPGKIAEFQSLLQEHVDEVVAQDELGVAAAPEIHSTFVENAIAKARHASVASGGAALADDSGICVAALGGRPGVRSARYAPSGADGDNNQLLLEELADAADRAAFYHCSLVMFRHPEDAAPLVAEGQWHGVIGAEPRGEGGFGYDPLFVLPDGRTAAELAPADKNAASHRGLALARLLEMLERSQA